MENDRTSEHERTVLGAIFLDREAMPKAYNVVKADDFQADSHKEIYATMVDMFQKGSPIDIITVMDALEARNNVTIQASYLADLVTLVPSASNIAYYAKLVREASVRRSAQKIGYDIQELSKDASISAEELVQKAYGIVVGMNRNVSERKTIIQYLEEDAEFKARVQEAERNNQKYIEYSSGFDQYDYVSKGMYDGLTHVIGAAAGTGKTYLAINMIKPIIASGGYPVFISIEQTGRAVINRLQKCLKTAGADMVKYLRDDKMAIIENVSAMEEIVMIMQSYAMQHDNCVFFVDYIQIVQSNEEQYERITNAMLGIRDAAKRLRTPAIVLSQMNQEHVKKGKAGDSGFKGSGAMIEYGDVVSELRYDSDDTWGDRTDDQGKGNDIRINWLILKNKEGIGGKISLLFNGDKGMFRQMTENEKITREAQLYGQT